MKLRLFFLFSFLMNIVVLAQPINDDPCNAIPLTIGTTCNQTTANNFGATASAGVPAPGCGTYTGGDVWFSVTCPASGTFSISTNFAGLNNLAIATYTGSCSSLNLAACNYIGSGAGNFPHINVTGATGGVIYYIRAWNPSNTTLGDFDICVTTPSPTPPVPNNQDCLDAIPICQSSFTTTTSYSGTGSIGNEINSGNVCLSSGEKNDVWYQFTVQNAGQLCFCIDPLTNTDDYDWAMFNLSSANCSDIYNSGASLVAACNYSGVTGWYGGGSAPSWVLSNATNGCTGLFPTAPDNTESQCGPCVAVTAGQSFVLNISNFSSTASGFHLFFPPPGTAGMAIIYDNVAPSMSALPVNPQCGGNQMFVKFSENVQCSTVQSADFSLSGPGGSYTISSVAGPGCLGGGTYENQFLLSFTPALTTPGTYTVCLTNASGSVADACNNLASPICYTFSITGPSLTATPTNPNCSSGTGTVVATASAGTGPYNYSINGGAYQASGTFTALAAGIYTITTIDNGTGCQNSTTSTITIPTAISVTATPANATCANNDGSIATTVSGGTAGYTYAWAPSGTGANPGGLSPATYTVIVTDSKGCTKTATAVIAQTGTVTANFTTPTAQCLTGNSYTFTNTGTAGVTYSWNYGDASANGSTATATHTYGTSGTFTITETVTSGVCVATKTAVVTVNPMPTVTVNSATMCPGATSTLTATGANTYTWSPAAGLSATTGASVTNNSTVTSTYTITGTSVAGCTATTTSTVTIGGAITPAVNSATICAGSSATLTAVGATTYTWSPGTGLSATTGASVTANPASTTTYTITGASGGCSGTVTSVVTVNPMPTVGVNSPSICVGASIALNAVGATTYSWSPSTGLSATTGASVTANPTVTTTYTVVGTSATCTAQAVSTVTVNPIPTVTVNSASVCPGASATLTATGASTYTWNTAATGATITDAPASTANYTVTGTSAAGCVSTATASITVLSALALSVNSATLCTGSSTTLNALGATTYSWTPSTGLSATSGTSVTANPTSTTVYTVTGSSGTCSATATSTVTINSIPTVTVNTGTICADGIQSATLIAGGASTYSWSPATGLSSSSGASVVANPSATTSYTVTGTDVNGCVGTNTTSVTVNPLPTIALTNALVCNGGSATLNASGAVTYTWSPGTGLSTTTGSAVTANPSATTNYTVVGTDANGCMNLDTTSVTVVSNPIVSVAGATICNGSSTILNANGATTYAWGPATGLSATTGSAVTANPNTTTVYTITGTLGTCTAVTTATVIVNPLPVLTISSNSPVCVNSNLTFNSSGGPGYAWSGPNSFSATTANPTINGVTMAANGTYTLVVTDANSCVSDTTINVVVNPLPMVTANGSTVCVGGTITLSATGGTNYSWNGPASYSFTSNQPNPTIANATTNMSGNYVVLVTDTNGCSNASFPQVVVNPSLVITAGNSGPVCQNDNLTLNASSGVSWTWSGPGSFTSSSQNPVLPNAQPVNSGTYVVVGTDALGCQGSDSTVVTINPLPVVSATSDTICFSQQIGVLTASGASTYVWSPATGLSSSTGNTVNASPSVTTTYSITGTDIKGCVNTASSILLVNPLPTVTSTTVAICLGSSTTITASGALTYTWSPATGLSSSMGSPLTANPTTTTAYTVTGTDANGCYNSGTGLVTVNPLPVVTVNTGTICAGKSTTLTALGAYSYIWGPATGLNITTGATVSASPGATTTYSVIGTDINGCKDTVTTSVTVIPLPVLNITPSSSSGCAPVCVSYSNTTSATGTCSWTFGDNTTSSVCAPTHCYIVAGNYTAYYTLTDANGCQNTDTAKVSVYPVPVADFSFDPQPTTILDPVITFHNESGAATIISNAWTFGETLNGTSTAVSPTHTYQNPGSYPVTLIVASSYGCMDTVTKVVVIGEDYFIYVPNAFSPNEDGINETFFAKGEGIKDFKMYIFDRWGNQVFYSEDIYKGWDGRFMAKGEDIVQEDVYVWKIECKTFKGELKTLKGTVTLIK